jgi:glycosyltransferase involved in cell wall biosynthesis
VRILLLSTSMGMGGADQQLLSAAQLLRSRGHQVLLISLTPLGAMGLQARNRGVPTESLEMRRGFPDPRGLIRLHRLIRHWRPDIVHSHMFHANLMARALRLVGLASPALVSTIHSVREGGRVRMAAYRMTNGLVDQMTIVSEVAAQAFITTGVFPRDLLRVIPNGVDTERFRKVPAESRDSLRDTLNLGNAFVWLAVGRFEAPKDYPTMVHAFSTLRRQRPGSVLLLVGEGPLQAETEALAEQLTLSGAVRFLGVRNDVPELMRAADAYVMSSAWEGMPVVLLEAGAAGLPIVATAVGGNPEVVRNGESGLLVPPGDPAALAEAMLRLSAVPESQRRAMGARGQEHVRVQYGLERMVERWEDLYSEVMKKRGIRMPTTQRPAGLAEVTSGLPLEDAADRSGVEASGKSGGQR